MVGTRLKFSVILPTYNRADVISYAIQSVLTQTEKDFELLIVGDGCTDNTKEVVSKFLGDKRVRWFDYPKGPGFGYANRNKAFRQARGEFIAFMAHDDIIFPDHLELLARHFHDPAIDIVYSRPLWVDGRGQIIPSAFNLNHPALLKHFMNVGNAIPASCFVHRRKCFDDVGYWDEKLAAAADWDLYKRIIRKGRSGNFSFEPAPTVMHYLANWQSPKSFSDGHHGQMIIAAKDLKIYPAKLRLQGGKKSKQEITWNLLNSNDTWLDEIRKSSQTVLDAFNWSGLIRILDMQANVNSLNVELSHSTNQIVQQSNTIHNYEQQLGYYRNSTIFRIKAKFSRVIKPDSLLYRAIKRTLMGNGRVVNKSLSPKITDRSK